VVAANLATQDLEQVRGFAADPIKFTTSIALGRTTSTQTVGRVTYTINQDAEWVGQRAATSDCDSAPGSAQLLRVTALVSWPAMGGTKPVQSTTTLAPPVGAYDPSTGSIAVKVFSASGAAQAGVPVTAVGSTSRTQNTTADGCAFFAYETPATYRVSLAKAGYVDDQEAGTPSQTASVTVGTTTSMQFNYDVGATINVSGWSNPAPAAATGVPVSVANTGLQPYRSASFGAGSTALSPLFPYPSGYVVFAGSCTDADPIGLDSSSNQFYPGQPTTVAVTPGGVSQASFPLYSLAVQVLDRSGQPVPAATLTATATGGTCSAGSPTTYGLAGVVNGASITGVPLGHLHLTATSGTSGTADVWVKPDGTYDTTGTTKLAGPAVVRLP
jgi:hypothetical protein